MTKTDKEAIKNTYVKVWGKEDKTHMTDYCMRQLSNCVKLHTGEYVIFEKPEIKKTFCYGYNGYSDEQQADIMVDRALKDEKFFIDNNLSKLQGLYKAYRNKVYYIAGRSYGNIGNIVYLISEIELLRKGKRLEDYEKLTNEDIVKILAVVKEEIDKFTKRLHTYLKRYGLKYVHTWSYDIND